MSTSNGPGQTSPYLPPEPPARRGTSPWVWVAAGCGLLTLLTIGGCIAFGTVFINRATQAVRESERTPLTEQQVRAGLGDTPLYPGAKIDIPASKRLRAVAGTAGGFMGALSGGKIKITSGALRTPAPAAKVLSWYETKFSGWRRVERSRGAIPSDAGGRFEARQFQRGDRMVQVQIGTPREGAQAGGTLINLIVFSGLPQQGTP
jgi:hypothetical protein